MVDNLPNGSTGSTPMTNETTTLPVDGLGTGTAPTNEPTTLGAAPSPAAPRASDSPAGAPEAYTPWTVPEGYVLDPGVVEKAGPLFKELGLSQEQGQKLVNFYSENSLTASKEALESMQNTRREWVDGMKSDPTLSKLVGKDGGFGPDSRLMTTINQALDGLQNPKLVSDFRAAADLTGAGDNPAIVRVIYALASMVTEGNQHAVGNPVNSKQMPKTAAAAMYPNLPSAQG
jgi:hypothetical protein